MFFSVIYVVMSNNCRKRWTTSEKQEILDFAKTHGATEASRKFNVTLTSIKNWRNPERYKEKRMAAAACPIAKEKNRIRSLQAYRDFPERIKDKSKQSRKKRRFKRLVEMSNRFFSRDEWLTAIDLFHIAHKQKLICALTGEKLTNENISVDHIVAKSKGGSNRPENIRLVHKDANLAKRALSDSEFLDLCQKVVNFNKRNPAISDGVSDSPD